MFVVYELVRSLPSFSEPEGALRLMAGDKAMLSAPMIFGWLIAAIPGLRALTGRKQPSLPSLSHDTLPPSVKLKCCVHRLMVTTES
jgi:hypothetical protein